MQIIEKRAHTDVTQVSTGFLDTGGKSLFSLANPYTGIVELEKRELVNFKYTQAYCKVTFLFGLSAPSGLPT